MSARKILIMGLPGAGKTTLAKILRDHLRAVHLNADEVRAHLNIDLSFSLEDRIEQARRLGWISDQIARAGTYVVADFVCPTPQTRAAFQTNERAFVIWVDRIKAGRFEDTNRLFVPPAEVDLRVPGEGSAESWAERACELIGVRHG